MRFITLLLICVLPFENVFANNNQLDWGLINKLMGDGDYLNVIRIIKEPVLQGDRYAQHLMGRILIDAKGVKQDLDRGQFLLENAARKGMVNAQYDLGVFFRDYAGTCCIDKEKSYEWFLKAAKQNHLAAQYNLGMLILNGNVKKKDIFSGFSWLHMAASSDHLKAKYVLGRAYLLGVEVEFNEKLGFELFSDEVLEHISQARIFIDSYKIHGRTYMINQHWLNEVSRKQINLRENNDWRNLRRVLMSYSVAGVSLAQLELGHFYASKMNSYYSNKKAIKWFKVAANNNELLAYYILITSYSNGLLDLSIDHGEASKWAYRALPLLQKKAEQNDADAMYMLASLYSNGIGVEKDLPKAVNFYKIIAKNGDLEAIYRLARIYENEISSMAKMEAFRLYGKLSKVNYKDSKVRLEIISKSISNK